MKQSELTLSQVFQRVECIVQDHNQKSYQNRIIEVCMKQGCTQSNILCGHCKVLHNDHREKLVNISEIEEAFIELQKALQQDNEYKKLQEIINQFESLARKQFEALINDLKRLINPLGDLKQIIMENKLQSYFDLQKQITELQKFMEFDNFKVKFKYVAQNEMNFHLFNLLNDYLLDFENFWVGHGIFIQQIQESQNGQQQQQQNLVQQVNNFEFSQISCQQGIKCITPYIVKNIQNSYSYQVRSQQDAYLNRSLQQYESASLVFKINCLNMQGLIGLGVCQNQKVQYNLSNWWQNKLNNGYYLALSDGSIYNSDYQNYNGQKSNFKMVEGQCYRLKFDPQNLENKQFIIEQVGYSKNNITMPMIVDYVYHYSIFAHLQGQSSEIEIVQEL